MMYTSVFTIWSLVINISDWSRERLQIRQCCSSYWIWQDWSGNQHPRHQLTRSSNLLFALHTFLTKLPLPTSHIYMYIITFLFKIYMILVTITCGGVPHHERWLDNGHHLVNRLRAETEIGTVMNMTLFKMVVNLSCWYSWFILSPGDLLCSVGRKCNWCRWAGSRPNSNFSSASNVSGF